MAEGRAVSCVCWPGGRTSGLLVDGLCSVGCFCVAGIIVFMLSQVANTFHIYRLPKKLSSSAENLLKYLQYFQRAGAYVKACVRADTEATETVWLAGSLDHSQTNENVLQV